MPSPLVAIHNGAQLAHTSDLANLPTHLAEYRPTLVLAVPRVFEKLYNTAQRKAEAAGHTRLFQAAETTAVAYSEHLQNGRPPAWLRLRRLMFDRLVYAKLRGALGGHVRYACSGGAPLGARLGHFLRGAGITVLEGWGATETTAGVSLNLPAACRIGTVGRPLPGNTVRIGPGQEILVQAPNLFRGYWHDQAATAETFTADGWLRTGELGRIPRIRRWSGGRTGTMTVVAERSGRPARSAEWSSSPRAVRSSSGGPTAPPSPW